MGPTMSPTGALFGLLLATALILVMMAVRGSGSDGDLHASEHLKPRSSRLQGMLHRAGLDRISPAIVVAGSALAALVAGMLGAALTGVPMAALLMALAAGAAPALVIRRRARHRSEQARASWPDAVDVMVAGIRAGLSLPDAVTSAAMSGPEPLRPLFAAAAIEHRATGSFDEAMLWLQERASDPVADRVVVALRLARELGGTTVGEVLRTLSAMLREDARIRAEIRGRQSWTVSAARMAVAAPWLTLLLLSTRPEAVAAFATPGGALVLGVAAALTAVAYALMARLARLPELPRLAS